MQGAREGELEAAREGATSEDQGRFFELSLDMLCIAGFDGYFKLLNPSWEKVLGYTLDELRAAPFLSFVHPEDQPSTIEIATRLSEQGVIPKFRNRYRCKDGTYRCLDWSTAAVPHRQIMFAIARDVTEQVNAAETIRKQAEALMELSTPLIPISQHVLVMPLIGAIDTMRAKQVLNTLLEGVSKNRARVAILDITGVSVVDTQVANALVLAASAVKLLGAEVVLTGIRPEVANTLVSLGADLSSIVTRSTLQSGIQYATRGGG